MVTDADDDQNKEGVDWDPNEWNRKCDDNKADGQGPEDCQGEIQRYQFSWKSKFNIHLIPMSFNFLYLEQDYTCFKKVRVKEGWADDWWILMVPSFTQEILSMCQGYEE